MNFSERVYEVICKIPRGKVASYGQIARALGSPRASRAVGRVLHVNPDPDRIPCHRVVNKYGRLAPAFAFGGPAEQKRLLEEEGVKVDGNLIDMDIYGVDALEEDPENAIPDPEEDDE